MNRAFVFKLFGAILTSLPFVAAGQELIPNGGFETYTNCPKQANLLSEAAPWYNPNKATPDFYHTCFNTGQMELPPHSGQGLAALFMDLGWAEYLATPLKQPLKAGEVYQFDLYVSSGTPNRYPSESFGAYFSSQPLTSAFAKDLLAITGPPQVLDNSPQRLTQRYQWEKVGGCLTAKGGEQYVTIGNFVKLPVFLGYYYLFVDDISLRPVRLDLGRDTTLCGRKSTYRLNAQTPGAIDYKWSTGETSPTLQVSKAGKYWVTVVTPCKVLRDTITVSYKLDFSLGPDTTLCEEKTLTLRVPQAGVYRWQDGSQQSSYQVRRSGQYTVQATNAGCTTSDTISIRYVLPPKLDLGSDKSLCGTEVYTIRPVFSQGTFRWLDDFEEAERTVSTSDNFRAAVTNECATVIDTVTIAYAGCPCEVYAPDAFSPNADGVNDVFQPTACGDIIFTKLSVLNRWGEVIFQTSSPPFAWNGTYQGDVCPMAVYAWHMDYTLKKSGQPAVVQTKQSRLLLIH